MYFYPLDRNAYAIFVKDNMGSTRMEDSGRLDIRKLADMWKNLSEGDRDVRETINLT